MAKGRYSGGRKKSPLLFGITFRAILIVAAAAMLLSYLAVYINPAKFSLPLFFGLYFIPILAINIFLLVIALLRHSASAWITIAALLPALLYTELFVKIGHNEIPQKEGIKLSVASYNVGMFSSSSDKLSRSECREHTGKFLNAENPDIVCMQEFFAEDYIQADTIFGQYPYRHYHLFKVRNGKLFGNIILSKFPIKDKGRLSFSGSTNLAIYADIEHYGRTLRVYNSHLESYNVSFTALAHKFAERLKNGNSTPDEVNSLTSEKESIREEIARDIVETHEKMKGTFIKRSGQVASILENINGSAHRSIICGDFNDTPMSYTYHTLAKHHKDTFREAGSGFGATFIPIWPLLRIDYILTPSDSECITHTIHRTGLSDHYPVSAEVII